MIQSHTGSAALRTFQPWLVRSAIAVIAVLLIAMIWLIWYSSFRRGPANARLTFQGDATLEGAVVVIRGDHLSDPITAAFTGERRYTLKFWLPPGIYEYAIKRGDKVLIERPVELRSGRELPISFQVERPTTGLSP